MNFSGAVQTIKNTFLVKSKPMREQEMSTMPPSELHVKGRTFEIRNINVSHFIVRNVSVN